MALNKRLLRKVRNRIAEIPESYDQSEFCATNENAPCGTAACLAGETIICAAPTVKQGLNSLRIMMGKFRSASTPAATNIGERAAKLLGLTEDEANRMFEGYPVDGEWPEPFGTQYADSHRPGERAKVAVAYLDECLKRGKVTW